MSCPLCSAKKLDPIVYETESFFVVPALGAFIEGYLLITTKSHELNVAQLVVGDTAVALELAELKKKLRTALVSLYNQEPVFFEHGVVNKNTQAISCVDHAHIHVVPYHNIAKVIDRSYKLRTLEDYYDLAKLPNNYIVYEFEEEKYFALPVNGVRQYFRRVLADDLGLETPKWNWRYYPYTENFNITAKKVREELERIDNNLSEAA